MQELKNWKEVSAAGVGLKTIRHNVWQNKENPALLGYVRFQGLHNGKPNPKFINRIQTLENLDHPNILNLLEYDLEAERPYMVTELCEGGTLKDVDLESWTTQKKLQIHSQLCDGYAYLCQKGYTKSDHNFKNVFLKKDDTPVLGDFEDAQQVPAGEEGISIVLDIASKMFWELMEGKRYGALLTEEMRIQRQLDELTEKIEMLEQQKAELLNKPARESRLPIGHCYGF